MNGRRATVLAGVLLASLVTSSSFAQCGDPAGGRPRVGLVLSGGAALGSAHVGVIKVLEEMRVPVDCVAGTSMGAIVGGLYAAGISPAQMEEILATTDWRSVLDDRPPRRRLPYRRKVDDQSYLTRLELGFNDWRFQVPPGMISGQKLGFALQEMALQAAGVDDFDRLPIPFRAAATDLATGELVVLRGGDLASAMRASMSVPGVFSPVVIDGRTLVDGGLARNLPVDLVRAMGADVVIAVDVSTPQPAPDKAWTIGRVTGQVIGFQIAGNVSEQAGNADVLIRPDLEGFGSSQFERSLEMVPRGEIAARAVAAELAKYAAGEEDYRASIARVRAPRSFDGAKIASITLSQSSTADTAFVLGRVKVRPGDPLDLEAIRRDVERLYDTGDYERVDFRLRREGDDFAVELEAIDKPWGPDYLRFGLNVFADLEGESSFDLLASYTKTRLNRRRGELKLQAQLGENPAVSAELYQPLSMRQSWFVSLYGKQGTATEPLAVPDTAGAYAPYRLDTAIAGADLGLQLGPWAELRLGLFNGKTVGKARSGGGDGPAPGLPDEFDAGLGGARFVAVVDQFDNMNFPTEGYFVVAEYAESREALGAEADYSHLVGFAGFAATHGRHTILGMTNLYSALGTESPEVYTLGGLFRLSGVAEDSVRGQYGGNATALYLYRVGSLPLGLGGGIYAGGSLEAGNLWASSDAMTLDELRYAGSLTVGADTVFGPMYLAAGLADGGDAALYLFVGRTF